MDCTLRPGDRVLRADGRDGVLVGIYAGAVAWVRWDQGPPSYEALTNFSRAKSASTAVAKPATKAVKSLAEEAWSDCFPSSLWPRARSAQLVEAA
jgi:hypothetical protein